MPEGAPPPTTLPQAVKERSMEEERGVNVVLKVFQAVNPLEGLIQGPTVICDAVIPSTSHFCCVSPLKSVAFNPYWAPAYSKLSV